MVLRNYLVFAVFSAATVAFMGSSAMAQGRGPRGGGFGGPGGGGKLMLLQDEAVQKELEIVPDQLKELEKIRDAMRTQMRDAFSGMRDLPDDQRRAAFDKMREKMRGMMQETEAKVNKILLPNQVERLNQIDLQQQLRRRGADSAVTSDAMVKALGITDAQKKQLQEKAAEVQKELQTKIQKAREEAQKEILSVLKPDQQAKFKKLIGEQFQMPDRGFGGRRANRPGGNRPAGNPSGN